MPQRKVEGSAKNLKDDPEETSKYIYFRVFFSLALLGFAFWAYINEQNKLTALRLAIPALSKEVKKKQEEISRLHYEIDQFESPIHLMELARKAEFSHLKYPYVEDVLILPDYFSPPDEGGR